MLAGGSTITFGSLPLLTPDPAAADYTLDVSATEHGTDWGNPEAVVATVFSMLTDGDRAKITRFSNRQIAIRVKITGANLDVVAKGEEALMVEVNRGQNTLTLVPAGVETASVFDVVYSVLTFTHDDAAAARGEQYGTLTLTCHPFARRDTPTTIVAEPIPAVPPLVTVLDNGTSVAGWSAVSGDVFLSGGGVAFQGTTSPLCRRTGMAAAVADAEFVVVDIYAPFLTSISLFDTAGKAVATDIVAVKVVGTNRRRWYFSPSRATVVDRVEINAWESVVFGISVTDQLPFDGSRQQRSFTAMVPGTARTAANLRVELNGGSSYVEPDFLLFTAPTEAAIAPPMRKYLSSSAEVTQHAVPVSGARQQLSTPSVYSIPAANIPPGAHLIVARVNRGPGVEAGIETIGWSTSINNVYADESTSTVGEVQVILNGFWKNLELGVVDLPGGVLAADTSAAIDLTITGSANVGLDEVWLFNLDTGVLTWLTDLDEGDEQPSAYEIRSATIDQPRPDWRVGAVGTSAEDISVAGRAKSAGVHEFLPGLMDVFIVTAGGYYQTVTAKFYDRFAHRVTPPAA